MPLPPGRPPQPVFHRQGETVLSSGTPWLLRGPSFPTCRCLCVLISDWKITGILVSPPLAPIYTQEERREQSNRSEARWTRRLAPALRVFFCGEGGRQKKQSAGDNSRAESQRVCTECHRSRAVYLHEAGWFNGAAVSPSHRLWTDDRCDSRLDLAALKTTLWIWNGACCRAKFSASEKHRDHE